MLSIGATMSRSGRHSRRDIRRHDGTKLKIQYCMIFLIFQKIFIIRKTTFKQTMTKKSEERSACSSCAPTAGCRVEAVLTVDERGQMVLPKDVRERAGIRQSDKLALISWEKDGAVCCLALLKVENLSGMVQDVLGPLMNESGRMV